MIKDLLKNSRFEFGDQRLCGFVNVESGSVEISTRAFYNCQKCAVERTKAFQVDCSSCDRSPDNSITFLAGNGDGNYPVLDYWPENSFPFSVFLCDPELRKSFSEIQSEAFGGNDVHISAAAMFRADISRIFDKSSAGDIVKAGSIRVDTRNSVQFSRGGVFMTQLVFADSHRNADLIDGASVSVPMEAKTYEVFAFCKELETSLESGERPTVQAIVICPAGEEAGLFGERQPLLLSEQDFFKKSDGWIEASRAGRSDILALMANWNLAMWWGDKSPNPDDQLFSRTAAEAYLHQLNFWNLSGDPLKAVQFELDNFSVGLEMAQDPIETLNKAKLSWLAAGPATHLDADNRPL